MTAPDQLVLSGVDLRLGDATVLRALNTRLAASGISVLLGPNGSGKTMFLRLARGLLKPSAGVVRWGTVEPRAADVGIGYVPQHPIMLRRSVRANLKYALARAAVPAHERPARLAAGLHHAGLDDRADFSARHLSGGQRQRLAIARAWVQQPSALLLDEPCVHLDPAAAAAVEHTVRDIASHGTKVILASHDLHQARRLGDEILFLCDGQLVEQATVETFFDAPRSEAAARFLAGELLVAS